MKKGEVSGPVGIAVVAVIIILLVGVGWWYFTKDTANQGLIRGMQGGGREAGGKTHGRTAN